MLVSASVEGLRLIATTFNKSQKINCRTVLAAKQWRGHKALAKKANPTSSCHCSSIAALHLGLLYVVGSVQAQTYYPPAGKLGTKSGE